MDMNMASDTIGLTEAPAAMVCLRQWFINSSNASFSRSLGNAFMNGFHLAILLSSFIRKEGTVLPKTNPPLKALELAQNAFKASVKIKGGDTENKASSY